MELSNLSGYLNPKYAASLSEFGEPYELPNCGGWVLVRDIPDCSYEDTMGCYPLFFCKRWSEIGGDIAQLTHRYVSLSFVTDPFGDFAPEKLADKFDICIEFKKHFITDLSQPVEKFARKRLIRYAVKALDQLTIEHCDKPDEHLAEWFQLYDCLKERHKIRGIQSFSQESFRQLLKVPGVEMFVARTNQETVGACIWLVTGNVGYGHLFALSPYGYELNAACALYYYCINYFTDQLRWLDFGGVAGTKETTGGLDMFKSGWTTGTRPVYFCGCILDKDKYNDICSSKGIADCGYFPAYRVGEFA